MNGLANFCSGSSELDAINQIHIKNIFSSDGSMVNASWAVFSVWDKNLNDMRNLRTTEKGQLENNYKKIPPSSVIKVLIDGNMKVMLSYCHGVTPASSQALTATCSLPYTRTGERVRRVRGRIVCWDKDNLVVNIKVTHKQRKTRN